MGLFSAYLRCILWKVDQWESSIFVALNLWAFHSKISCIFRLISLFVYALLSVEQSELKLWDELSLLICPWVRCLHFSCTYIGRTFNRHTRKENALMGDFCSKDVQRICTNSHLGNSPIGASFYIKIRFYSGIKLFYTTPFI